MEVARGSKLEVFEEAELESNASKESNETKEMTFVGLVGIVGCFGILYSSSVTKQYVTTAIDYPNAAPHMGHVLEKVLADVCVRWMRLRGDDVRFQIGTDEHGIKIQQTAKTEGVTPRELVDRNVPMFQALYDQLQVSYDVFIRTSDAKMHWPTVVELWNRLKKAGALEKRTYTGLYCSGCERFVTDKDLVDGKCPDHGKVPEQVSEENWFFLLGREGEWLKKILTDGTYSIIPGFRAAETLSLIEQGLEDVSFSRPVKSLSWGIPVPGEEGKQTMYVWCDALTNYISGLGLLTDHPEDQWWDEANITHVIGKDIARFHALIWPAMLKQAKVKIPNQLLIHGFLTSEGQKMSKSIGNVVVPRQVIDWAGVDAMRFYLSHEIPVGNDGDFSWDRFQKLYDSKLRNLGNLLNRALVLFQKFGDTLEIPTKNPLSSFDQKKYEDAMNIFDLSEAISLVLTFVSEGDKYVNDQQPWKADAASRAATLGTVAELLRHVAWMLLPFIPATAQRISKQLNVPYAETMLEKDFVITSQLKQWGGMKDWKNVGTPEILFAPLPEREAKE